MPPFVKETKHRVAVRSRIEEEQIPRYPVEKEVGVKVGATVPDDPPGP